MKKNFFLGLIALTALTVTSCSNDDVVEAVPQNQAIEFGTYLGRDAESRGTVITTNGSTAGQNSAKITTDALIEKGFGVFAYYTDGDNYDKESSSCNFIYNSKVSTANWTYSPVKYWPNDPTDKLTFFAYAPFNETPAQDTDEKDNIGFSVQASLIGDPIITFDVNNEVLNQQDLLWSRSDNKNLVKNQLPNNGVTVTDKVEFQFAHALARIGFTVKAVVDEVIASDKALDANTTIVLKEVRLVNSSVNGNTAPAAGDFYQKGTLNLNNPVADISTSPAKANWITKEGSQYFTLENKHFVPESTDNTSGFVINNTNSTETNKLNKDDSYIMIIPRDFGNDSDDDPTNNTPLYVYVDYDVITTDTNLQGGKSTVTNHITQPIRINFESGKAYTLNLLLGMTSVKVTADVDLWVDEEPSINVNLPTNTPEP